MAQMRGKTLKGISELGAIRGGVDVSWGFTTRDGASLAFSGSDRDVTSGQSTMIEDSFRYDDQLEATVNLLYTDLLNMAEAFGVIAGPTGDLQAATPTAEVLELMFDGALGKREDKFYLVHPGPSGGPRRWVIARMKVKPGVTISAGAEKEQILTFTLKMLRPKDGTKPVTITDAP